MIVSKGSGPGGGETMSTEIYYFSGTGNSLFIARELQRRLPGSELIPIVSLLDSESIHTNGT